jgi:nucleoside-diphosphate-sugar epimerase
MKFTLFGASGFIGGHLQQFLKHCGHEVYAPGRDENFSKRDLGHVVYCIGLTADFRRRPLDTADAHVTVLNHILRNYHYDSLLYLSSTRVYGSSPDTKETAPLVVRPGNSDDLYNLTKLTGEALCLSAPNPSTRVARLSNVYARDCGSESFFTSILSDALRRRHVHFRTALNSSKDYISMEDVVMLIEKICLSGQHRLYNIASGKNVTHSQIATVFSSLGCDISVDEEAPRVAFSPINIDRIVAEFCFRPADFLEKIPEIFQQARQKEQL